MAVFNMLGLFRDDGLCLVTSDNGCYFAVDFYRRQLFGIWYVVLDYRPTHYAIKDRIWWLVSKVL